MPGEKDLSILLKHMQARHIPGAFVFCSVKKAPPELLSKAVGSFQEQEGLTLILDKKLADQYQLSYTFIAAWITLDLHSALDAVGLTAAFSKALTDAQISCNVVAAYYHDHIFVDQKDAERAMEVLHTLSKS